MTRHERFAATALQGLIAARSNLDIAGEVEMAWRYGDAMEDTARQRELPGDEDSPGARAAQRDALADQGIEALDLVAGERYERALTAGLDAAVRCGDQFTDREAAAIAETIGNFGVAVSVSAASEYLRCALSGFQCPCRTYTFHVRAGDE